MTTPKLPLTCRVKNGVIQISVNAATVEFATVNHPALYDPEADEGRYIVTDQQEWLKGVAHYITDEREDGSSRLTDLFDSAILEAIEQGWEGVAERKTDDA
jgi:hypothetical protein